MASFQQAPFIAALVTIASCAPAGDEMTGTENSSDPIIEMPIGEGSVARTNDDAGMAPTDDSMTADPANNDTANSTGTSSAANIYYHGGPVVTGTPTVYFIWYGNWTRSPVPTLLADFARSIGGTSYYRINTSYSESSGGHVDGRVDFGGGIHVGYTHGRSLSASDVLGIVNDAITGRYGSSLPWNPNGFYVVMGARDVYESGLCGSICGWHAYGHVLASPHDEVPVLYSFIGNPLYCEDHHTTHVCAWQPVGPNGSSGADGMASVLAHELSETVTDPEGNAWFLNPRHRETGDLCAWRFGRTFEAPNHTLANVNFGGHDWLLQLMYNKHLGRCTIGYGG